LFLPRPLRTINRVLSITDTPESTRRHCDGLRSRPGVLEILPASPNYLNHLALADFFLTQCLATEVLVCWRGISEEMETAITLLMLIILLLVSVTLALIVQVSLFKGFLHVIYARVDSSTTVVSERNAPALLDKGTRRLADRTVSS
jgi:hypothetical protein